MTVLSNLRYRDKGNANRLGDRRIIVRSEIEDRNNPRTPA